MMESPVHPVKPLVRERRGLFLLIQFVVFIVLLGVVWAALYANRKGFTRNWREQLIQAFEEKGVHLSMKKLTLDPIQGLSARGLVIYRDKERLDRLLNVSRVNLDLDYTKLGREEVWLNHLDLNHADLTLPIEIAGMKDRLDLRQIQMRVGFNGNRIEIRRGDGFLYAFKFRISGHLERELESWGEVINQMNEPKDERSKEEEKDSAPMALMALDWLKKIESTSDQSPEILIELEGDPTHWENLKLKFRVEGRDLRFEDMEIRSLKLNAEMDHGTWRLHEFLIEDDVGGFHMSGVRRPGDPWIEFSARSSMNLVKLIGIMFGKQAWSEVQVSESPKFAMDGKWWLDTPPWIPQGDEKLSDDGAKQEGENAELPLELTGEFESGPFFTRGVSMNEASALFSMRGGDFYLRNLNLQHQTGRIHVDFMRQKGELKFNLDSTMDLTKLSPIVDHPVSDEIWSWFKIRPNSKFHIHLQGGGSEKNLEAWEVQGGVNLANLEFKGLDVQNFEMGVKVDGRKVRLQNMKLQRQEGTGTVEEISFDRVTEVVEVKNCQAQLIPGSVVRTFNPSLADEIEKWKFPGIPKVKVSGYVAPEWKNHLQVVIDTEGHLAYNLAGKDLPLTGVDGSITFIDQHLHLDFSGKLYGGNVKYQGKVSVHPKDPSHSGNVQVANVNYGKLYHLYRKDDEPAEGDLTGHFKYWANDFELDSLNGEGAGVIVNGDLYSLPFLGPLTSLVREMLPSSLRSYNTAKQADATWVIRNGVLTSQDMTVEADAYVMRLGGQIDMVKDQVGIDAEVEVRGVPGVLLLPVTSLMTYRGTGTMEKTDWELKIISSKEGLKEVPGKILTLPFKMIHKPFKWMRDLGGEGNEEKQPTPQRGRTGILGR